MWQDPWAKEKTHSEQYLLHLSHISLTLCCTHRKKGNKTKYSGWSNQKMLKVLNWKRNEIATSHTCPTPSKIARQRCRAFREQENQSCFVSIYTFSPSRSFDSLRSFVHWPMPESFMLFFASLCVPSMLCKLFERSLSTLALENVECVYVFHYYGIYYFI